MSSLTQIDANRANAQFSTGPRTEAGKSRAALNARKHGLTSSHLIVVASEREAFASMHEALADELAPRGELESTLFDTILHANWNIRRCRILEAGLLENENGVDPMLLEQNEAKLRQLDRQARRHDSNFHRAVKQLRVLQTERAYREPLAPAVQNEPNAAAAPSPLANTQSVRQQHLRDRAAKTRIDAVNLGRALDRLLRLPEAALFSPSHPTRAAVPSPQ